jgi:hypothetical protein
VEKLDRLHYAALACATIGIIYVLNINYELLMLLSTGVLGYMLFNKLFQRR